LKGKTAELTFSLSGGDEGAFALHAVNIGSDLPAMLLPMAGPQWQVSDWRASGRRQGDGVGFTTTLQGEIRAADQTAKVELDAQGDGDGVRLTKLDVTQDDRILTHVVGRVPLVWMDYPRWHWRIDQDNPLEFEINSEPASPLWPMLAAQAGIELTAASARAKLTGTLRQPQGDLQVRVGRIRMMDGKHTQTLPDVDHLTVEMHADRREIALKSLSGLVAGQKITAGGQLPMDDSRWNDLWSAPQKFDWGKAEGYVEIVHANLAPLAQRIRAIPLVQGTVDGRVEAKDGRFTGRLQLHDAISRPLGALGIVQAIDANLILNGRRLTVQRLAGQIGGEPVVMQGGMNWPAGRAEPELDLTLKGGNLPLIRRPGLLLRGDIDLAAKTGGDAITRITGAVTLHDGLVLADLATLLPSGRRGVERRPPYFSVETDPLKQWQLGVDIRGAKAVRIRTTVFKGTASAHFQLSGTLGEPRAVGELTVDQAQVLFPFATFAVQLGVVRLRAADPYNPELALSAVSHRHDYEIRLNVTGSPEAPMVAFSSNPPLEASQVLLMVMTGQSPAGDPAAQNGTQRLTQLGAYLGRGLFGDLNGDESRLEIASGQQASQQGRETYEIEYKLNDTWSLTGEYDRFDDYNAGVKWRVYTQESKSDESK
jgi:translocation and assembly module TamB